MTIFNPNPERMQAAARRIRELESELAAARYGLQLDERVRERREAALTVQVLTATAPDGKLLLTNDKMRDAAVKQTLLDDAQLQEAVIAEAKALRALRELEAEFNFYKRQYSAAMAESFNEVPTRLLQRAEQIATTTAERDADDDERFKAPF